MLITESEKNSILKMYGINIEEIRPLQKLLECKFTSDGKYVLFEGKCYSTITGNEVPINEGWTLSDILHTGADVLSAGLDFVIPGSGAVVDILNAISYVIEAQFKNAEEKDSLYIMAAITFGFVILPGPLQALATPLKRAVKTGKDFASPIVKEGLKIIGGAIDTLLLNIPTKINQALKSPLAKGILGRWGKRITEFIDNFTSRIKQLLGTLTGKSGVGVAGKESAEKIVKDIPYDKFKEKFLFDDWTDAIQGLLKKLPSPNMIFNPSKVKVLNKTTQNFVGRDGLPKMREVIEAEIEDGQKLLFYKSSGSNTETTGKKVGEWFVIPGWRRDDGWFIKTKETNDLTKGGNKYLTEMAQFLEKNGVEGLLKSSGEQAIKLTTKSTLTTVTKTSLTNFFRVMPKISKGSMVLRKLGFVKGKTYRYIGDDVAQKGSKVIIDSIDDSGVMLTQILKSGEKLKYKKPIPIEIFVKNAIGAPWMRRGYSVVVPLFIKRFSDVITSNGDIDYSKLENLPDLDPNTTSEESLQYLQEEVAEYEGGTGKYTKNTNATTFQNALMKLGYSLPKFGADGKFGPETQNTLKKFQQDNNLTSSIGKMDRITARKLAELLKTKNITGTEDLQRSLNEV